MLNETLSEIVKKQVLNSTYLRHHYLNSSFDSIFCMFPNLKSIKDDPFVI